MARVTHVKRAQARYATVPVIDPETGEQKVTPVMRPDGTQKVTKHGKPVVLRVTAPDKDNPLPNHKCDRCGEEIAVGQPYKWIRPKSGPYGGSMRVRCADCPSWNIWEYSYSLSARTAQISHEAWQSFPEDATTPDEINDWLGEVADEIDSLAQEKEEAASNIEDGFGHATSSSEELSDIAQQLEGWASEVRDADVPDLPEPEAVECEECDGTGKVENPEYDSEMAEGGENEQEGYDEEEEVDCAECDGTGEITSDDPTEDQMNEWLEEVREAVAIVDDCPV